MTERTSNKIIQLLEMNGNKSVLVSVGDIWYTLICLVQLLREINIPVYSMSVLRSIYQYFVESLSRQCRFKHPLIFSDNWYVTP